MYSGRYWMWRMQAIDPDDTLSEDEGTWKEDELWHLLPFPIFKTGTDPYCQGRETTNVPGTTEKEGPWYASILSSVWNGYILDPKEIGLQDTNDRFLANLQRGGSYSIVPRVPGGEITPDKLIVIGEIAKEYGLYTKITGGQRIDLFGAEKHQLPEIWGKLVSAGFESGHAYGKALRTVKSCVGSSWCRFGMRDSVGFAILLENRYKGIRSPHKIKGGVSGCIRECAEARGKDFGLIAVEGGYNLYVCGNGGSKPKHAVLLVSSVSEEQCVKYLDRFIAFYITTADKLQRTARWLENLEGGIAYLRKVIVEDILHIADSLEQHMDDLISTYKCEWKTALERDKRKQFDQFVNSEENQDGILKIEERGQKRPVDRSMTAAVGYPEVSCRKWVRVAKRSDFGEDSGRTVLYGKSQIAVFNFSSMGKWYATQNLCPHENELVLSQGMLSSTYDNGQNTLPTVACPMHKREYSLEGNSEKSFLRFPVRIDGEDIMLKLPSQIELDEVLATDNLFGTCKGCEDPLLKW
jgi:dissimilatory sulfite reductase (desulfoviridin) alpha/beta subunit/nitrite reductase/ring-hydroxylating ferredoxin subunit